MWFSLFAGSYFPRGRGSGGGHDLLGDICKACIDFALGTVAFLSNFVVSKGVHLSVHCVHCWEVQHEREICQPGKLRSCAAAVGWAKAWQKVCTSVCLQICKVAPGHPGTWRATCWPALVPAEAQVTQNPVSRIGLIAPWKIERYTGTVLC